MFNGSFFRSTLRAGIYRQASRVYGSGPARAFSGLIKNFKIGPHRESPIVGNLGMKLGLISVLENVSLPCTLRFRSFIHSGDQADDDAGITSTSMDNVMELLQESGRFSKSTNNAQGVHQERGTGVNGRPPFFQPQAEGGRTLRSMDYVQGLLHESGNGVNERRPLYEPQGEAGRTARSMDRVQGLLQDRGSGFGARPPLYQPQVESNADIVHIKLMRNNSYVTLTDSKGNRKIGVSAGQVAAKGDKPGRYAGEAAAEYIGRKVRQMKTRSVVVKVSGFTFFRRKKDAVLAFKDGYTNSRGDMNPVVYIEDTTRKPHNGCRLPKKRRI